MANKYLIIGVVAVVLVASVAGAALLLSNQGEADKKAHFKVTSLTLSDSKVVTGQPLTASIGMKNTGAADGDYEVRLFLDGVQVNRTLISVGAGEFTTVELGFEGGSVGTSTVRVDGTNVTFECLDE